MILSDMAVGTLCDGCLINWVTMIFNWCRYLWWFYNQDMVHYYKENIRFTNSLFLYIFSYTEYIKSISICTSKCCPLPNAKWKSSSKAVFYERTARFSMYFWCIILLTKEFSTDVFLCWCVSMLVSVLSKA
jgi:hypothetical protein